MKPKVYIRADGSHDIGLGHLIRCIALAHMLKNDFDITFVCKEIPEKIKSDWKYHKIGHNRCRRQRQENPERRRNALAPLEIKEHGERVPQHGGSRGYHDYAGILCAEQHIYHDDRDITFKGVKKKHP